jgi:hypothetical protein
MKIALTTLSAAVLALASAPAAALTVDNITYSLSHSLVSAAGGNETWSLTLDILNNSNDGRTAVTSFAFNRPASFVSAALPGWTTQAGGLNASGCSGAGNFFCFSGYAAAAANMSFTFSLTAAAGALDVYAPDFKIDWIGSRRNYDLVSQVLPSDITPVTTPVPEPGTYAFMLAGLGAMGFMLRRRRQS